jgi:hypothetical protein
LRIQTLSMLVLKNGPENCEILSVEQGKWDSDPTALQKNESADVRYVDGLITYLEQEHCIDTSLIFATGMGVGGGLVHLLACDEQVSRRIAAFAAVGGAFYTTESPDSVWFSCNIGRRPIPFLEIHGNDDQTWSYWPPEIPNAPETDLQAIGPAKWIKSWAERNNCGRKDGEARPAAFSNATILSPLENGKLSEGVEYGGGAVRVAYSCPPSSIPSIDNDDDIRSLHNLDLLHYSLKDEGYGWPRKDLKQEAEIMVNGIKTKPPGEKHFDATKVMFEWFVTHRLPNEEELERQKKELEGPKDMTKGEIKKKLLEKLEKLEKEKEKNKGKDEL